MENIQLIAVIEVPQDKKVLCQSEGCGRSVYKSVHIIRMSGGLQIVGSECFKKYIGKHRSQEKLKPLYGSGDGIPLTAYERELLLHNTEQLISEFESKYANTKKIEASDKIDYSNLSDTKLQALALKIAKDEFRKKRGLDPELPGWAGLIKFDAESIYKEMKEQRN